MSLVVSRNPNGTLTVTCDGESMTVGSASPSPGQQPGPAGSEGPPQWPNVTPGGVLVSTNFRTKDSTKIHVKVVRASSEMLPVIEGHIRDEVVNNQLRGDEPPLLRIVWVAQDPLDISELNEVLRSLGAASAPWCEIVFASEVERSSDE